jgi:hypothetical protein
MLLFFCSLQPQKNYDQINGLLVVLILPDQQRLLQAFLSFFSFVPVWCQQQGVRVSAERTAFRIGVLQSRHLDPHQLDGISPKNVGTTRQSI